MAAPILPVGTGIGPVRSNPINVGGLGSAEAAFRKDAASGGMLKSAQEGILQAIKNLTSGTGSISSDNLNVAPPRGVYGQSPERTREAAMNRIKSLLQGGGFLRPEEQRGKSVIADLIGGDEIDIFSPDSIGGLGSIRMPLTGVTDVPGGATFGGTIPESRDPNLDVDIGAAGLGVEPPADSGGSTPSTATTGGAGSGEEGGGFSEADANQALVFSGTSKGAGDKKEYKSPYEEAIAQAMKSYEDTKSGKDTGVKGIEYYKDEFSKATGIDISGEADNRAALMAFGLALMQNKAGKGFDVGNILSAVGAAGEKALPVMEKTRQERRAGQIAAGKYALEQRAKDKATVLATEQAALTRLQDLQKAEMDRRAKERLELIKGMQTRKTERLKTELKMLEDGEGGNLEFDKTYNLPFATGQGAKDAFDIIMAYDKKNPNKPVIIAIKSIAYKSTS